MSCSVRRSLMLLAAVALALAACGGSGGGSGDTNLIITGTAATGAAIDGAPVTAKGANGQVVAGTTQSNGGFTLPVNDLPFFPALVKVDNGGQWLFGIAFGPGTVNLTPLTTLALLLAFAPADLTDEYQNWQADYAALASTDKQNLYQKLKSKQAIVNANFAPQISAVGLDPKSYDFVTQYFSADGSGIDGLLSLYAFAFDFTQHAYTIQAINGPALSFNVNVDTTDYCIGCGPAPDSGCISAPVSDNPTVFITYQGQSPFTFDLPCPASPTPKIVGFSGAGGNEGGSSTLLSVADAASAASGARGRIVQVVKSAHALESAGTVILSPLMPNPSPFTSTDKRISVRVWSPLPKIKIRLKVDNGKDYGANDEIWAETESTTTSINHAWQTLDFNFAKLVASKSPVGQALDLSQTFRFTISFNFGVTGAQQGGPLTFYFDEIIFRGP